MKKHTRTLLIGVSALFALGTLSACSSGTSTDSTTTSEAATTTSASAAAAPFPQSAKYIADMTAADGKTMTIGIAVDGAEVAAYACNGTDDEAWFFGTQTDGDIDITSKFRDTLKAEFNGTDVEGDLTMNGVAYEFTAPAVPAPAGMYTAAVDGSRASWVIRPDGSAIGVQFNGTSGRDFEQAELQQLKEQQFRDEVRNKRLLLAASEVARLQNNNFESRINGKKVTLVVVNGNFRL